MHEPIHHAAVVQVTLKTMMSVVRPLEIAAGRPHQLLVFDSNGILSTIDTQPAIPCGNAFEYTSSNVQKWGAKTRLRTGRPVLLTDKKTVYLRRASASKSSPKQPYRIILQKKILEPFKKSRIRLTKFIFCSKRRGLVSFSCCVRKDTELPKGSKAKPTRKQLQKLRDLIMNL